MSGKTIGKESGTAIWPRRAAALLCSGALASAMALPAAAYAGEASGSVGESHDEGTTELRVQLADTAERTGSDDVVAFTVPSAINFVARADGTLIGPSASAAAIDNDSMFGAYVSGFSMVPEDGWNVVADAGSEDSSVRNAVSVEIGPDGKGEMHAISESVDGAKVLPIDAQKWRMLSDSAANDGDKVKLATSGSVRNVDENINAATKFAMIQWHVKPGNPE